MKRFTAYRMFILWDRLQEKFVGKNYPLARVCSMQKVRLSIMYDLK